MKIIKENNKAEYIIPVIAREKSIKDSEGKSVKGKVLGESTVNQYSLDTKGQAAYLKRHNVKRLMELANRQLKTDVRNDIAASAKSPEKGIKTKCKVMVDMIKSNESLRPIFISEVHKWTHIDKAERDAVVVILKAA